MSGHHHHHHHGDGGHCHGEDGQDHSNDITPAIQSLLYSQIDFDSITTLNGIFFRLFNFPQLETDFLVLESTPKAGAAIVKKTWAERLNDNPELESDADEQLLMYIPSVTSISKYLLGFVVYFVVLSQLANIVTPPMCPSLLLPKKQNLN